MLSGQFLRLDRLTDTKKTDNAYFNKVRPVETEEGNFGRSMLTKCHYFCACHIMIQGKNNLLLTLRANLFKNLIDRFGPNNALPLRLFWQESVTDANTLHF